MIDMEDVVDEVILTGRERLCQGCGVHHIIDLKDHVHCIDLFDNSFHVIDVFWDVVVVFCMHSKECAHIRQCDPHTSYLMQSYSTSTCQI
jgi:hypothetical protein